MSDEPFDFDAYAAELGNSPRLHPELSKQEMSSRDNIVVRMLEQAFMWKREQLTRTECFSLITQAHALATELVLFQRVKRTLQESVNSIVKTEPNNSSSMNVHQRPRKHRKPKTKLK